MHPLSSLFLLPLSSTLFVTASAITNLLPFNPSLSPASNLPLPAPHNITSTSTSTTTTELSFLDTITLTVLKTTAKYPTATYRLVRASSPSGPTTSLSSLTAIRITFSLDPATGPFKSLHVDMSPRWSVWDPPTLSPDAVPDDVGNMRLDVRMDLDEAWQLIGRVRMEVFESVRLYWPALQPGVRGQQPFYRFEGLVPRKGFVYVGAWSKEVKRKLGGVRVGNESLGRSREGV